MANRVQKMLNERYERKQRTMFARVTEIPQSDGRSLGYVVCEIGGNAGISVRITDPNLKYYVGDTLQVTEVGTPANASYFASGFIAGPRPTSGMYEFTDSIALAEHEYSPGDILFGDPYGPNWMFDYAAGDMYLRTANQVNGIIYNDGVIELGPASGVHTRFRSDGFVVWSGEQILSAWDGLGRTVYGIETWGRPHGPGIQTKEFVDDEGNQRYGMQIIGFNGVPGISLLTGTLSNPEDYRFYIGLPSASAHMEYEGGDITLTGRVYQSGGNLDGIIGIGNYGGIWQGSGSMSGSEVGSGSPDTGLRIWAENGVGRLTTYKSGSVQVELDTEGQLLWAAGQGVANASGMTLSATIPDMFVTPLGGIGIAENFITNTNILTGWEGAYSSVSALGNDTFAVDFTPVFITAWLRIAAASFGDRFGFWVRNLEGVDGKIRWGVAQGNFGEDPFTNGENASALVSPSVWTYVEANIPSASWIAAASTPRYYYIATDGLDSTEYFEVKNPHAYTSLGDVSPNFLKTAGYARSVDGIWATGRRPLVVTASTLGLDIVSSASGARIFATSGIGLEISTSLNDYGQKITSGSGLIAYSPYGHYIHINPGENITLYPSRRIIGVADAVSGSDAISLSFGDARYIAASSGSSGSSYAVTAASVSYFYDSIESGSANFSSSGNVEWQSSSALARTGSYSLRSGSITHSQVSNLYFSISPSIYSRLSFWYMVSSEADADAANLVIDGVFQKAFSGTTASWTRYATDLSSGSHTILWSYSKDSSTSTGSDAFFLDDVRVDEYPATLDVLGGRVNIGSPSTVNAMLNVEGSTNIEGQLMFSGCVVLATNSFSTFLGKGAGGSTKTGLGTTGIGISAGGSGVGDNNVWVGRSAGVGQVAGFKSVGVGAFVFQNLRNGQYNVGMGYLTGGQSSASYNYNVFLGGLAGYGMTQGDNNIFIGQRSAFAKTSGCNNVFIGFYSGYNNTAGSGNVFIGYKAGENETGSDKLYITSVTTASPLVFGTFTGASAGVKINSQSASGVPLTLHGVPGQSQSLQIWEDSQSASVANMSSSGVFTAGCVIANSKIGVGVSSPQYAIDIDGIADQNGIRVTGSGTVKMLFVPGGGGAVLYHNDSGTGHYFTGGNSVFSGFSTAYTSGIGWITALPGDTNNIGYLEFYKPNSARQGYIGYGSTGINVNIEAGAFTVNGGQISSTITASPPLAVSSSLLVTNLNADKLSGSSASQFAAANPPIVLPLMTGLATNLSSNTTYYWGIHAGMAPQANVTWSKIRAPRAGRITRADIMWYAGTPASVGSASMFIRVGDAVDYEIETVSTSVNSVEFSSSALSASIAKGDWFVVKLKTPAWATCPANVRLGGTVYMEAL